MEGKDFEKFENSKRFLIIIKTRTNMAQNYHIRVVNTYIIVSKLVRDINVNIDINLHNTF